MIYTIQTSYRNVTLPTDGFVRTASLTILSTISSHTLTMGNLITALQPSKGCAIKIQNERLSGHRDSGGTHTRTFEQATQKLMKYYTVFGLGRNDLLTSSSIMVHTWRVDLVLELFNMTASQRNHFRSLAASSGKSIEHDKPPTMRDFHAYAHVRFCTRSIWQMLLPPATRCWELANLPKGVTDPEGGNDAAVLAPRRFRGGAISLSAMGQPSPTLQCLPTI